MTDSDFVGLPAEPKPHAVPLPAHIRELAIDTMASWALEGMYPTPQILADIEAYLAGEMTRDEFMGVYRGS